MEAPGVAIGSRAVEQQGQPFGVGEIAHVLLRFELDEGLRQGSDVSRPAYRASEANLSRALLHCCTRQSTYKRLRELEMMHYVGERA